MERLTRVPWGVLAMSALFNGGALVAILAFGAPPVVLLPVTLIGATIYAEMVHRVSQHLDRGQR